MQSLLSSIANSQDYNVLQRMCKIRDVSSFSIICLENREFQAKYKKLSLVFWRFLYAQLCGFYMKNDKHSTATINLWIRRVAEDLHLRKRAPYFERGDITFLGAIHVISEQTPTLDPVTSKCDYL